MPFGRAFPLEKVCRARAGGVTGLRLDPRLGRVALKNSAGKNQLAMPLAVCADHALARLRETGIAGRVDAVLDRYHGPLSQDEDPQAAAKRYGELLARDLGLGAAELAAFGPHEQPFNFHRALGAYLIERLPAEGSWWRSERKWTRVYASPASDAVIEQFPTCAQAIVRLPAGVAVKVSGPTVYTYANGTLRPVASFDAFKRLGSPEIFSIGQSDFAMYPQGELVQ